MIRLLTMSLCLAFVSHGSAKRPGFQDYVTHDRLEGPPSALQLTTSWSRQFRTRIRRGAASQEGFRKGAEYVEAAGPNFAGHYRVVTWGCGSGCLMMVIVDLRTGTVYPPPMSAGQSGVDRIAIPQLGTGWADFDFRVDSKLFIMETCPWGSTDPKSQIYRGSQFCGTSYFIIESDGFHKVRQIREELIPVP